MFREAIKHFASLGYPVPEGANAADHFISLLTEAGAAADEGEKNKVKGILDAWEAYQGKPSDGATETNSIKSDPATPKAQSDDENVVTGFALGFFEELWWLTRR